ncbi:dGTP triphosphohydrolase [Crystallibacter degradans]|uniref:dGTP triphosphohydrolase n=1 Tax=Crystallibacter degradans TaxID=2726743 RepID=UPI0014752EC2|nr:dNTP triphosphohydrolase [Arthrobacter sp. SF27]
MSSCVHSRTRNSHSHRTPTRGPNHQRDRDRILYSEAFRRLGGVTQVATGTPSMSLHNRLTHSLKVEQVGVSIYTKLSGDDRQLPPIFDMHAIAAACLAHDLGHPPFGHAGEQELDALVVCGQHQRSRPRTYEQRRQDPCSNCKLEDGFEGNAQSLRISAVLSVHKDKDKTDKEIGPIGLDLTRASLAATTKYPWLRGAPDKKASKWGAYDCDKEILEWAVGRQDVPDLNAQVMDWADDISYAVHDIEDFYRIGLIPLNDYKRGTDVAKGFLRYAKSANAVGPLSPGVEEALYGLFEFLPRSRFTGTTEDLAALDRLRGTLLTSFIRAAKVESGNVVRDPIQDELNGILKQLIWFHIIDEPTLANIQVGQRQVLRDIFGRVETFALEAYKVGGAAMADEQSLRRLPNALRRTLDLALAQDSSYTHKQKIYRGILDFISGLSDSEAYYLHAVLAGREHVGHL